MKKISIFGVLFLLTCAFVGNSVMISALQNDSARSGASSSLAYPSVSPSPLPQQFSAVPTSIPQNLSEATMLGPLSTNDQLSLQLVLPLRNNVGLSSFLSQVYDPASSLYHQFLTPSQFYSLYGPDPAETAALTTYMQSSGLQLQMSAANPNVAEVRGTVAQIQNALKTQVDSFSWNGTVFYSATSSAQLPPQFSNIQMIYGLENLSEQRSIEALPLFRTLGKVTSSQENGDLDLYYSPLEIRQAYNATSLLNEGYSGTGVSIAIVDAYGDPYIQQELQNFSAEFGLPLYNGTLHVIPVGPYNPENGILYGWNTEVALDVEWAHAMAPNATINLYVAADSGDYLFEAVLNATLGSNGAAYGVYHNNVISMSWGLPENDIGSSAPMQPILGLNYPWLDQVFQMDAALGITAFASSGDWGAYDQGSGQSSPYGGSIYPSTDPYVTGVGGTSLYINTTSGYYQFPFANATGTYANEAAWSWSAAYLWGTGGGWSTLFGQPSWQTGLGVLNNGERGDPDVAWDADPETGVLVCVAGEYYIVGGTSIGSPCWAGSMALIDQKAGRSLGFINPTMYSVLNNSTEYSKAFHDITIGNNDPYTATKGWDPLTGVGSPNLGELAYYLAPAGQLPVVVTNDFNVQGRAYAYGQAINLTAVVADNRTITGPVTAIITSSTGTAIASNVVLTYDAQRGAWLGSYAIRPTDPPGEWSVTITATNGSNSGEGYTTLDVGDGVTIWTPSSWTRQYYQVGDTISISSYVVDPSGNNVTNGAYTATFHLAQNQTTGNMLGKAEGKIKLQYDPSSEFWEGNLTITGNTDQATWIIVVNGTDPNGNKGTAYTWINVGLDGVLMPSLSSTYVLGDEISMAASFIFENGSFVHSGAFTAVIYCGTAFVAKVPLTLSSLFNGGAQGRGVFEWVWIGGFNTSVSDPTGFYTLTVNGTDGEGNSGTLTTVFRVAPYRLSVQVSVPNPKVPPINGNESWILAKVTYPDGSSMTTGNVNGFIDIPYPSGSSPYVAFYPPITFVMTYNPSAGGFIVVNFFKTINVTTVSVCGYPYATSLVAAGNFTVHVEACDALGNYGDGTASFQTTAFNHASIDITKNADLTSANGVTEGNGTPENPYLIAGWSVSSISITNVTSSYELLNDYVSGSAGDGITINTPKSKPTVMDVDTIGNQGNGLYADDSPAGIYSGIVAESNGKDGILIVNDTQAENGTVSLCWEDNATNGIVYEFSNQPTLISNTVSGNAQVGLLSQNSYNATFLGNYIYDSGKAGIEVTGQHGSWYGCSLLEGDALFDNSIGVYVDGLGQNLTTAKFFGSPSYAEIYSDAVFQNSVGIYAANNAVIAVEGASVRYGDVGISTVDSLAYLTDNSVESNSGNGIQMVGQSPFEAQQPARGGRLAILSKFGFGHDFGTVAARNTVESNGNSGISINATDSSLVIDNIVEFNHEDGVELNNVTGISLENPTTIILGNSIVNNNDSGIEANGVTCLMFVGQSIEGTGVGLLLSSSSNNTIDGNDVTTSNEGIMLLSSKSNDIYGNNITANDQGIFLNSSSNNAIHHNNFINNTNQAISNGSPNTWDNGYPSGGNYWSNYQTRYPNANEIDSSGIWNTPYVIDSNNTDHYPLAEPQFGYSITFYLQGASSDFTGTVVTIDGTSYKASDLPVSFLWTGGSVHTFSFASTLSVSGGKRITWGSTTGLSTFESGQLIITSSGLVTGNFKTQYYLNVNSPHDTPSGLGWYDSGSTAYATLTNGRISGGLGTLYVFTGWSSDASGTGLKSNPITMNAPKTATADWKTQYLITLALSGVGSDFTGTVVTIDGTNYKAGNLPASLWYDSGSVHSFMFNSPLVVAANEKQYVWNSTSGFCTEQNEDITVYGYGSVTANYTTQYYLTVKTVPTNIATITGQGWYEASSEVLLTAPETVSRPFLYWSMDGISLGASTNPVTVQMNAPHTATAYYSAQLVGGESIPTNTGQLFASWITTVLLVTILLGATGVIAHKGKEKAESRKRL
jgi:parallel beta-helix repeat protein